MLRDPVGCQQANSSSQPTDSIPSRSLIMSRSRTGTVTRVLKDLEGELWAQYRHVIIRRQDAHYY